MLDSKIDYAQLQINTNSSENNSQQEKPTNEEYQPVSIASDIKLNSSKYSDKELPPQSIVQLISNKGRRYQLTFKVKDPEFHFLYIKRRKSPENLTQKSIQACSKDYFVEVRDLRCQKFVMRMKRYRIALCSDTDTNNSLSNTDKSLSTNHKKLSQDQTLESQIYIEKDGILFLMTINSIKVDLAQRIVENDTESVNTIENKKGIYNAEPNRASLVARINDDIVRVRFKLVDCDMKPVSVYVSRGCQYTERYAYLKFLPQSAEKPAYCAVPLTTYMYKDPMILIRKRNYALKKNGRDPEWMIEQRRKRRESYSSNDLMNDESSNLLRSVIVFEMNGHRVKLRCGFMNTSLINGASLYDDFVICNRNESRAIIRSPCTTFDNLSEDV